MVKAIVCGGRDYRNRDRLFRVLDAAAERLGVDAIVEGGQRSKDPETDERFGADWLAKSWAIQRGLQCDTYYAAWDLHGKAAGPMRNAEMLAKSDAELVIAFPGGAGTADMVRRAEQAGVEVKRIDWA
jgi:hypothetical protein